MRVPDAVQRSSRCSAEPGPYQTPVSVAVPVLRSGMKNAASRPGQVILLHQIGAHLADQGVLIAGAAAAADGADQLAGVEQREAAGAGDQRRIERRDIRMTGL